MTFWGNFSFSVFAFDANTLESSQHCAAGVQLLVVLLLFGPRPQVIVYREGVDRHAQMLGVYDRKAFGTRIVSKQK